MKEDLKKIILSQKDQNDEFLINYDVDEYIAKLWEFATIIPYYNCSKLKGFIAYYSNDFTDWNAYLTIIVIDKSFRGEGIGELILRSSISDLINRGFKNYRLEVSKTNSKAITLYKKNGFQIEKDMGESWLMNLNLDKNAN